NGKDQRYGKDQRFGDEVRGDNCQPGNGRGRGRRCCGGVAPGTNRSGGRCRRRRHCGNKDGQRNSDKAETEAETCSPDPHEVGHQEGFSEETAGQDDIREAEEITSLPRLDFQLELYGSTRRVISWYVKETAL